jgi:hypothetical protein
LQNGRFHWSAALQALHDQQPHSHQRVVQAVIEFDAGIGLQFLNKCRRQ